VPAKHRGTYSSGLYPCQCAPLCVYEGERAHCVSGDVLAALCWQAKQGVLLACDEIAHLRRRVLLQPTRSVLNTRSVIAVFSQWLSACVHKRADMVKLPNTGWEIITVQSSSQVHLQYFSDCRSNEQTQQLAVSPKCMLLWPTVDK